MATGVEQSIEALRTQLEWETLQLGTEGYVAGAMLRSGAMYLRPRGDALEREMVSRLHPWVRMRYVVRCSDVAPCTVEGGMPPLSP
jgi:hypothetical protein